MKIYMLSSMYPILLCVHVQVVHFSRTAHINYKLDPHHRQPVRLSSNLQLLWNIAPSSCRVLFSQESIVIDRIYLYNGSSLSSKKESGLLRSKVLTLFNTPSAWAWCASESPLPASAVAPLTDTTSTSKFRTAAPVWEGGGEWGKNLTLGQQQQHNYPCMQRTSSRNRRRRSLFTVSIFGLYDQDFLVPRAHTDQTIVPSWNDLSLAQCEREWFVAVSWGVKFFTFGAYGRGLIDRTGVLHRHFIAGFGGCIAGKYRLSGAEQEKWTENAFHGCRVICKTLCKTKGKFIVSVRLDGGSFNEGGWVGGFRGSRRENVCVPRVVCCWWLNAGTATRNGMVMGSIYR